MASRNERNRVAAALRPLGPPVVGIGDGCGLVARLADAILGEGGAARPCLIVAEAVLPGCCGLTVLRGLRDLGWDTPVLLISAVGDNAARAAAWNNRVTGQFVQPVDVDELAGFARLVLCGELEPTPPQVAEV